MNHPWQSIPAQPPPVTNVRVLGWLRQSLFSSATNTGLTLLALLLMYLALPGAIDWLLLDAAWTGTDRSDCTGEGACWVFINARFSQFIYGFYPEPERWRVDVTFALLFAVLAALTVPGVPGKRWVAGVSLAAFPVLGFALLYGGVFGLSQVETALWGGLMLTLVIATVGIVASLPIGIILALGRRSQMPVLRALATGFIEFWRGIPLITVLFMASVMLPLFLPEGVNFDKLVRAFIGVALFQSAYMAEVVRGGLQAIPRGQYEAAHALGLSYWKTMGLIVLPQALKYSIPGIVNTFIALFKDTTLVLIIGLFDLLGIVQAALSDPKWLGYSVEGYIFAGFGYWIFCFGMSRYSQHLERRFQTGYTAH